MFRFIRTYNIVSFAHLIGNYPLYITNRIIEVKLDDSWGGRSQGLSMHACSQ